MDMFSCVLNLGLLLVHICLNSVSSEDSEDDSVSSLTVEAVAGSFAKLPCDVTPPTEGDKVHLIIWYKGVSDLPIYSFDSRDISTDDATHWSDDTTLGRRAYFMFKEDPATLTVENIRDSDKGLYRCRVDFRKSPTRNYKVNLTIILPPDKLSVLDERGAHIQHYILGPYNEGSSVDIICIATGGRPLPNVTWWQESSLLDDTFEILTARRVRNVLHLDRVERYHLNTVFTCQASNNNVLPPISSAVTLDLNLPPLWVKLQGDQRPFSADQTYELTCEVVGARPVPIITWLKGEYLLRNARTSASNDGNVTISALSFVPTVEDFGEKLICRAATSYSLDNYFEDSWTLNVYHVPLVNLDIQSNLKGSVLKEGMDVTLECAIRSNPWVYRISWKHNGKVLYHNASAGTVISNQSLILLNVTRTRSGMYSCIGSNQEGDGESDPVYLDIKYPQYFDHVKTDDIWVERVKREANPDQKSKRRKRNRVMKLMEQHQEKLIKIQKEASTMIRLEEKKIFFLKKIENSKHYREDILQLTINQNNCEVWFKERKKRLTASNFGRICSMRETTSCKQLVWNLLYNRFKTNMYIEHGIVTEPVAKKYLRSEFGIKVDDTGLFVDKDLPFLAASPDGLVGNDSIVEIKCPYVASFYNSPKEAVKNGTLSYIKIHDNKPTLRLSSHHYYQIQGQLHITGRTKCVFFVYTKNWTHFETIERDDSFWYTKMEPKLKRFYMECLLPEIVDPKYGTRKNILDIREGEYVEKAQKHEQCLYHYDTTVHKNCSGIFYMDCLLPEIVDPQYCKRDDIGDIREAAYIREALQMERDKKANATSQNIPICRPGQQKMIGIARQETAKVSCEVEANPPEVKFSWRFNSTLGILDLLPSNIMTEGVRSVAAFTPATEHDYGNLLCWAKNELGLQQIPCIYNLTPTAGKPERVFNCSIHNQTADTLHVECEEGYNGGLNTEYAMEVYDSETNELVSNATFRLPVFIVTGLPSGEGFDIKLYAVNTKGRSQSTVMHAYTLQSAARRSALSPVILQLTPMLGVFAGVAFSLFFVTLGIILGLKFRNHSNDDPKKHKNKESSDSIESLEKNPDIIPQNTELLNSEETGLDKINAQYYSTHLCEDMKHNTLEKDLTYSGLQLTRVPYNSVTSPRSLRSSQCTVFAQIDSSSSCLVPETPLSLKARENMVSTLQRRTPAQLHRISTTHF